MISDLAQERLLVAALGCIFTGVILLGHRRAIYESISETRPYLPPKSWVGEPIFGSQSHSEFAHLRNKAVDQTFRPVIEALNSPGCKLKTVERERGRGYKEKDLFALGGLFNEPASVKLLGRWTQRMHALKW